MPRHSCSRNLEKTKFGYKTKWLRQPESSAKGNLKQGWRYNRNTQTFLELTLKLQSKELYLCKQQLQKCCVLSSLQLMKAPGSEQLEKCWGMSHQRQSRVQNNHTHHGIKNTTVTTNEHFETRTTTSLLQLQKPSQVTLYTYIYMCVYVNKIYIYIYILLLQRN